MQTVIAGLLSPPKSIHRWFFEKVDARSFAAVRIATAVFALGVWSELWPLRRQLFSDAGMFGATGPRRVPGVNVFALANDGPLVDAVFVCALVSIACLGLGVFTRLASLGLYVWAVSYCTQTPISLAGYDSVLRVVSFSLLIAPASSCGSVRPHWFSGSRKPAPRYALRILQWQLLLIYWCTVWLKAPDQYWRRGEVISHMLMSNFARFPTPAAAQLGVVDALMTWGTLLIELLVPILLWKKDTRLFAAGLGILLHGGIALGSKLGLFSLSMVPLYFAFFEAEDWNRIGAWCRRLRPRKGAPAPDPSS